MLAQISLIGAGLGVAGPPSAGWPGNQGGVVDRGEFVTTAWKRVGAQQAGGCSVANLLPLTSPSATSAWSEFAAIALGGLMAASTGVGAEVLRIRW